MYIIQGRLRGDLDVSRRTNEEIGLGLETRPGILVYFVFCMIIVIWPYQSIESLVSHI